MAVNNSRAVLEALFGRSGEFTRTPKYGIEQQPGRLAAQALSPAACRFSRSWSWRSASTSRRRSSTRWRNGIYGTLPFLMLFQFGFLYMGLLSIFQQLGGDDLLVKAPQSAGGK